MSCSGNTDKSFFFQDIQGIHLNDGSNIFYYLNQQGQPVGVTYKNPDGSYDVVQSLIYGSIEDPQSYSLEAQPIARFAQDGSVLQTYEFLTNSEVPDTLFDMATQNSYRVISDERGSMRLVINGVTGAVTQEMDYDEFGVVTNDTNAGFQPFGFAGGLYATTTGYSLQDPVNNVDPAGTVAISYSGTYPSGVLQAYADLNFTLAKKSGGLGLTFGAQASNGLLYPYVGFGVFTGPGASLNVAPNQTPSEGLNLNVGYRKGIISRQVGYCTTTDTFSGGFGIGTPGGGASVTYVFPPVLQPEW